MDEGKRKAVELLLFAGYERGRLLEALVRKWNCLDFELLQDAYGETALRLYHSVVRRNPTIKDLERYFLRSVHSYYVRLEKRERRLHGLDISTEEETA